MTMMGRKFAIFIVAAACAAMCACNNAVDTDKFQDLKNKMEQEAEGAKPQKKEKKKTEAEKAEPEEVKADGLFAKAFADRAVENNGGLFVKVGDRVYFRIYNKRSLALTTMGVPYPSEVDELPSKVMYYDLGTDEVQEVCEVSGFGDLYASVEGLLLADPVRGTTTLIREDGSIEEDYLDGLICEVSSTGDNYSCADADDDTDSADEIKGGDEERDHLPGDVYLSEGNWGDLMARSYSNEDVVLYKDYIYEPGKHDMFATALTGAVCFSDDSVFLIKASGDKSPEEGKWAYDLTRLAFECYRFDEDHMTEYGPRCTLNEELLSVGWSCGQIDYNDLEGTWQMKGAIVEGFQYDDFSDSEVVTRIDFNEDGSMEYYTADAATGKKLSSEGMFIDVDWEEEGESDYAIYYTYDMDEDTVIRDLIGVCYLSGDRLGIYKRYHYDGSSIGWYKGSFYKVKQ